MLAAETKERTPARAQAQIETEVLGATFGSSTDGENSLMHADEMMERAEGDEILVLVASAATSKADMVTLK